MATPVSRAAPTTEPDTEAPSGPAPLAAPEHPTSPVEAPASSRVSAARAIMDTAPKLREALDLAERVTALERQLREANDREREKTN